MVRNQDFVYNPRKSVSAPYGPVNIYNGEDDGIISPLYLCMKIRGIDKNYLLHYFKSPAWYPYIYQNGDSGVRHDRVSIKDEVFLAMPVSVPNGDEQRKIAKFLDAINERIATQSKIIEELKTLRSALRYKLLHEMKVERMAKLGELCRITTGKLDANAMVEGGGYPFFTCAEQVYEIDRYAFDTEALLVSGNGANLGHIHYYCGKFNAYQRTYVLSDFSEDIQYLRQYLEAYLSKRIESEKNTGNTPYIVLGTLADMEIKLPRVPEQQRIAHDLSVLSQKIENETHMFELLIQEKKTLLGKMFI